MARRVSKPKDVADQIIKAAADVLKEKGYAHTGIRDIAAAAGVSSSQINYYFESKERLIEEVLRQSYAAIEKEFRLSVLNVDDAEERCRRVIRYMYKTAKDRHPFYMIYYDAMGESLMGERFRKAYEEIVRGFVAFFREIGPQDDQGNPLWTKGYCKILVALGIGLPQMLLVLGETEELLIAFGEMEKILETRVKHPPHQHPDYARIFDPART